ncbi:early growth response factor homolog 1-like [Macrobrachium nipponense]|uniref:early growth response factor homolog 1-like n=1 Tax=Macrobrachium nipponense TaxID=159736 RepID=UPI0030C7CC84
MELGGHVKLSSIKQENEAVEDDLPAVDAADSLEFMEPCVEIKAEPEAQPEFIDPDKIDVKYPCTASVKLEKDPLSCDEEYAKEIKEGDDDVQTNETPKDIPEIPFVSCGELLEPEWPSESRGNADRGRDPALAGKKVFTCSVCQHRSTGFSHFEIHMRTYTGEKPFSCTECNRSFSFSHILRRQMKVHHIIESNK